MSRWARRPPPAWKVKLVFALVALGLLLVGVERWIGWPDWATLEPGTRWRSLR